MVGDNVCWAADNKPQSCLLVGNVSLLPKFVFEFLSEEVPVKTSVSRYDSGREMLWLSTCASP